MKSNRTWRDKAACMHAPQYVFFPDSESSRNKKNMSLKDELAAKALCKICPVQPQCLQYALETKQDWGIWGGTTVPERKRLLRGLTTA